MGVLMMTRMMAMAGVLAVARVVAVVAVLRVMGMLGMARMPPVRRVLGVVGMLEMMGALDVMGDVALVGSVLAHGLMQRLMRLVSRSVLLRLACATTERLAGMARAALVAVALAEVAARHCPASLVQAHVSAARIACG